MKYGRVHKNRKGKIEAYNVNHHDYYIVGSNASAIGCEFFVFFFFFLFLQLRYMMLSFTTEFPFCSNQRIRYFHYPTFGYLASLYAVGFSPNRASARIENWASFVDDALLIGSSQKILILRNYFSCKGAWDSSRWSFGGTVCFNLVLHLNPNSWTNSRMYSTSSTLVLNP